MNAECRVSNIEFASPRQFEQDGFQILPELFSKVQCDTWAAELSDLFSQHRSSARIRIGGIRNLLRTSQRVARIASSSALLSILETFVARTPFPVRAIFFDKNAEANWFVPWHQDLTIAVLERIETPGFGGWSVKQGIVHVQATREVLEDMIAVRLHLDDCDASNGALRVLPGSHCQGILDETGVSGRRKHLGPVVCTVAKGSVLVMRPLLLHSSLPADSPTHRRVLHIEYATRDLPNGLKWFDRP